MRDNGNNIVIMILMICIVIMTLTIFASADDAFRTSARSAALYEPVSGSFIYSKNIDERLPMASTTKIMTGLLAIELCSFDDLVEVPKEASGVEGSSIYLLPGDTLTVKDLVYSLLLQSANDAAEVLAIKIAGDVPSFAQMMNRRASELGLYDTNFENPHGLDSENHYTTARDLARLSAYALDNPTFRAVVSTYKYSFSISDKTRTVVNHNKLLNRYDGAVGVKTGFTKVSGRCLVSAAERDGLRLIAVTLNAPDDWRDHTEMLDLGFSELMRVNVRDIVDTEYSVPLIGGKCETIKAHIESPDDIFLIKHKSDPDFKAYVDIKQYAVSPIKKGDRLGEVVFMKGNEEFLRVDIVASEDADKIKQRFSIFDIFKL